LQLGNRLLDHADQITVQRAITQLVESVPVWGLYRISAYSGTYGKVQEAIAREMPHRTKDFGRYFVIPRSRYPRNATGDSKVSADITKTKNVRRFAAVCSSFASTTFHCFPPDWHFS
jgi:hypothetical protein